MRTKADVRQRLRICEFRPWLAYVGESEDIGSRISRTMLPKIGGAWPARYHRRQQAE
jgi:hypothetical protein